MTLDADFYRRQAEGAKRTARDFADAAAAARRVGPALRRWRDARTEIVAAEVAADDQPSPAATGPVR